MQCAVCSKHNQGFCCRYWSSPQDFWLKPPTQEQLEHVKLFGGNYKIKLKLFGLLYRVYWILPVQCKNQEAKGACSIYEKRPQICKDYICEKDEFIEIKKELG